MATIHNNTPGQRSAKSHKDFAWDFDGSAHSPGALKAKFRANLTTQQRGGDG